MQAKSSQGYVSMSGSVMLGSLSSDRENLETSVNEVSDILKTGGPAQAITYYRERLSQMHQLLVRHRPGLTSNLKTAKLKSDSGIT